MKKLYKKGKVHPSPPSSAADSGGDRHHQLLALQLPATILTLAATLSSEDKQVLAYLISCCGTTTTTTTTHHKTGSDGSGDHPVVFECNCFRCYMSFWGRWDASPNRQLIHEIIEVYEEELVFEENEKKSITSKKKKKRSGKRACDHHHHHQHESRNEEKDELTTKLDVSSQLEVGDLDHDDDIDHHVVEPEKGSVRKISDDEISMV